MHDSSGTLIYTAPPAYRSDATSDWIKVGLCPPLIGLNTSAYVDGCQITPDDLR